MRDDQRPDRRQGDEDDDFDDALDDLFGPDDDQIEPRPSRQQPQPAGGSTPPPYEYTPDPNHDHETDEPGTISGPRPTDQEAEPTAGSEPPAHEKTPGPPREHERELDVHELEDPPWPSYDTATATSQTQQTSIPVSPSPRGRNWRRIACFGCLAAVGIPALCLLALLIIGLIVGPSEAEPTNSGLFVVETSNIYDPRGDDGQFVFDQILVTKTTDFVAFFDSSFRSRITDTNLGDYNTTFESENRCGIVPISASDEDLHEGLECE
jgi:hypothetical protein